MRPGRRSCGSVAARARTDVDERPAGGGHPSRCADIIACLLQIPYPLISLVSRMPMTIHGRCPLTVHTRTFETIFLLFTTEKEAIDVFESVKELTVTSECLSFFCSVV